MPRAVLTALLLTAALVFVALGVWQIERRAGKRDLIARVDARIAAPPVSVPPRASWPRISTKRDAYTRIRVSGRYVGCDSFVQASTVLGPGYWVITPLRTTEGDVLVNRGYVPANMRAVLSECVSPPSVVVTGMLRVSEPDGSLLRANEPAEDRWFSRDVAAIAKRQGLTGVAPFFIDADATSSDPWPRGGLTVVRFPNNHLVYALTWFGLAALSIWALIKLRTMRKDD